MFTVKLEISPDIEANLRERASRLGKPFDAFLQDVVHRALKYESMMSLPPPPKSAEEWIADWRAWVARQPVRNVIADDSRESIYEGEGE